jgi:hypothetical protein
LLFNKGIGVQRGNGFSFAFPNEEDANQAFHYICDLGTLQTSQLPKSEASLRTPQGEPALTQTDGLPGTREPVSQQPYGNAGESPALSVKSLSSPPLQVEIRAATSRGCSSTEDAGRPGPSLYTCDECGAPLRCGPTQWEYDCGHGPAQRT